MARRARKNAHKPWYEMTAKDYHESLRSRPKEREPSWRQVAQEARRTGGVIGTYLSRPDLAADLDSFGGEFLGREQRIYFPTVEMAEEFLARLETDAQGKRKPSRLIARRRHQPSYSFSGRKMWGEIVPDSTGYVRQKIARQNAARNNPRRAKRNSFTWGGPTTPGKKWTAEPDPSRPGWWLVTDPGKHGDGPSRYTVEAPSKSAAIKAVKGAARLTRW